jgi:hypothetical protein
MLHHTSIMTMTMSTTSTSYGTQSYHVSATEQTVDASGVREVRARREQQIAREMKACYMDSPGLFAQNQEVMDGWNLSRCHMRGD